MSHYLPVMRKINIFGHINQSNQYIMEKKEDLEIKKAPEELTEQDLEKVTGGFKCLGDFGECSAFCKDCDSCYIQMV